MEGADGRTLGRESRDHLRGRPIPNPTQEVAGVTLRLRNQFIDRQMAVLMHRINLPETPDSEREDAVRQKEQLRLLKRQPLTATS
jgi:hypothetical protein